MSDRDDLTRDRDTLLIETAKAVEALMDLARFSCGFEELNRARVAHQSGALQSARERLEDTVKRVRR